MKNNSQNKSRIFLKRPLNRNFSQISLKKIISNKLFNFKDTVVSEMKFRGTDDQLSQNVNSCKRVYRWHMHYNFVTDFKQ